jgi:hypothetical protein
MPQNPALSTPWKESGVFSPVIFAAPLVTFAVSIPLAAIYALINIYVPIVGVVTIFALAGFAFICGFAGGAVMGGGRSRNTLVSLAVSVVGALLALYSLWVFFLFFLMRQAEQDPSLLAMFLSPGALWEVMGSVASTGWFEIKGSTPSGLLLWLFWLAEAAIFVGVCAFASVGAGAVVWCEACGLDMPGSVPLETSAGADLAGIVKRGGLSSFETLQPDQGMALERLKAHVCSRCGYAVASVEGVTKTVNKKGELSESTRQLLPKHVVTRDFVSRAEARNRPQPAEPASSFEPSSSPSSETSSSEPPPAA